MMISGKAVYFSLALSVILSCAGTEVVKRPAEVAEVGEPTSAEFQAEESVREFNLVFTGFDINIDDPQWDRRSYYKIFIDKVEAGRTTIGLESQRKQFEMNVSKNRHLLLVEKWVLDEKKGKYIKLNNIEQPKPNYVYFDITDKTAASIVLQNDPFKNESEFTIEYSRD